MFWAKVFSPIFCISQASRRMPSPFEDVKSRHSAEPASALRPTTNHTQTSSERPQTFGSEVGFPAGGSLRLDFCSKVLLPPSSPPPAIPELMLTPQPVLRGVPNELLHSFTNPYLLGFVQCSRYCRGTGNTAKYQLNINPLLHGAYFLGGGGKNEG